MLIREVRVWSSARAARVHLVAPVIPAVRHVASCLHCGYREITTLLNSYPLRCPTDGREIEHAIVSFYDRQEMREVAKAARRRLPGVKA